MATAPYTPPQLGYYDYGGLEPGFGNPETWKNATPEQIAAFRSPYYDADTGQSMANPSVQQLGYQRDATTNVPQVTLPNGVKGIPNYDPKTGNIWVAALDASSPKGATQYTVNPDTGEILSKQYYDPNSGGQGLWDKGGFFPTIAMFVAAGLGGAAISNAVASSAAGATGAVGSTGTGLGNLGIDTALGGGTNLGTIGAGGAANGINTVTGAGLGATATGSALPVAGLANIPGAAGTALGAGGLGISASLPATAGFTGGALGALPNIAATGAGTLGDIGAGATAVNAGSGLPPVGVPPGSTGLYPGPGGGTSVAGPGVGPTAPGGIPPGGTTPGGTPGGTPGDFDWGKLFGAAFPALLGAYGANQQAANQKEQADRLWGVGQPSRNRYEGSYDPGFTMMNDPGYKDMMDMGSQSLLRGLSTKGNPFGNPAVLTQVNKDVNAQLAYPALQQYRAQNANTGGYTSFNNAAPNAGMTAATNATNWMQPVGAGIANYFNPPQQMPTGYDPTTGKFTYSV